MIGLDQTMSVYTPDAGTGEYTALAATEVCCRLALVGLPGADPTGERAEDVGQRRLLWEASYTMPDGAQVEVAGERWNVQDGSGVAVRGPGGAVLYRRCEVARAET